MKVSRPCNAAAGPDDAFVSAGRAIRQHVPR